MSHESQIWKELFRKKKRNVSNRFIFDCAKFRHKRISQLNLIEQFCSILCKLFILDIFFLTSKAFFLLTYMWTLSFLIKTFQPSENKIRSGLFWGIFTFLHFSKNQDNSFRDRYSPTSLTKFVNTFQLFFSNIMLLIWNLWESKDLYRKIKCNSKQRYLNKMNWYIRWLIETYCLRASMLL